MSQCRNLQVESLRREAPTGAIENSPAGTAGSAWGNVCEVPSGTAEIYSSPETCRLRSIFVFPRARLGMMLFLG